jgi:peptidoglycan L-alanyl-D-glutamate endopeptidase CwlK
MNNFRFGKRSLAELKGVHPDVVRVTHRTLELSTQDFGVHDGIRTAAEQNALYRRGASQKDGYRNVGKHQKQEDGFGHAVDLVPYVKGRGLVWDWNLIYPIALAMQQASIELETRIRWGGCWGHTPICQLSGAPENWVQAYVRRKQKAGKRAFNDGPHYELMK